MDAPLIIAIIVAVLIVALAAVLIARQRRESQLEDRRHEAAETRDLAQVARLDADRQAAEAAERAARAEHERLVAEQEQLEADRQREEAAVLHQQADELDPDVDVDAPRGADPVDGDQDEVDLRSADRSPH